MRKGAVKRVGKRVWERVKKNKEKRKNIQREKSKH